MQSFINDKGYSLGLIEKNCYENFIEYLNGESHVKTLCTDGLNYLVDTYYPNNKKNSTNNFLKKLLLGQRSRNVIQINSISKLKNEELFFVDDWTEVDCSLEQGNDLQIRIWSPIINNNRSKRFFNTMTKSKHVIYGGKMYVVIAHSHNIWWAHNPKN